MVCCFWLNLNILIETGLLIASLILIDHDSLFMTLLILCGRTSLKELAIAYIHLLNQLRFSRRTGDRDKHYS